MTSYIPRLISSAIHHALERGKSVLLLGPRQTGKTTLIKHQVKPDISYSFAQASVRQRYEQDPVLLEKELEQQIKAYPKPPVICIDEVQKIPRVMDIVQHLIDNQRAQFILTGSSARKLKTGHDLNLLPGRVVALTMTPLLFSELPEPKPALEELLLYGSMPGIFLDIDNNARETDLFSYVTTYMEEEIRAEAVVRNVGSFSRFLELAAGESGKQLNFTRLSQDIGVADTTIANYFQILEDCLIVSRIDPIIKSSTKRRLIKSPKYLFFDLGIRRACANEGTRLPQKTLGEFFEHYVGNELLKLASLQQKPMRVKYWRDADGPEVDYVLDIGQQYTPIEVKWTDKPNASDAKHLIKFMNEYPETKQGYIVCRTPAVYQVLENITALPWTRLDLINI